MKRFLLTLLNSDPWLLGLVAGLIAVAALCRFAMREANPVPADKTVITLVRGGTKRDRDELRELLDAFHARNPDVFVKVIYASLERKADTMIAGGVAPDILYTGCDRISYYLEANALLDLTPFLDEDPELAGDLLGRSDGVRGDFYEETVRPFLREENGRRRLYLLPVNFTPWIVYYSKDLFDRYHVDYPDEHWDWEGLRRRAIALTRDRAGRRPDQPGFDPTDVVTYGFHYAKWQHGPENFIRQSGGRLVSEDGTTIVADDPRTVAAIQFLYDLKYVDRVCPPGQAPAKQDISLQKGTLGMHLYGVFAIPTLRDQAPHMDWDIAPLPRGPDGRRASIVYTNAYGISSTSRHPREAFRFLRFLVSPEGMTITSHHQVFLAARRSVTAASLGAESTRPPKSTWALTYDLDRGFAVLPFSTRQYYYDVYDCINSHLDKLLALDHPRIGPREACEAMTREGNSILRRDASVAAPTGFGRLALLVAVLPAVWIAWRVVRNARRPLSKNARREERWGYALISPWLVGFLFFAAGPILVSLAMAFARWQALSELTRSEFIGVENFRIALSGEDPVFWHALWVTFRYALVAVPTGLVAGLALAILMNQAVRGIAAFRTLYYIPAVLPSVAVASLWWHLFDADRGWVNRILALTGVAAVFGDSFPVRWLESPALVPWIFVIISLWTAGGGMIIYLAGLQSIPTQLYEAAEIDGAGRWGRLRYVTLPMLSPVILFNLVMGIIGSFQVFNLAFVLFDGFTGPADSALFYGLHMFREAFHRYRLGYASALAWILFMIVLALTSVVFKSSPLWVHYEAAREKRA